MLFVDEDGEPEFFHPAFEDSDAIGPLDERREVTIVFPELHEPGEHFPPGSHFMVIEEISADRVRLWRKGIGCIPSEHPIYRVVVSIKGGSGTGVVRFIG